MPFTSEFRMHHYHHSIKLNNFSLRWLEWRQLFKRCALTLVLLIWDHIFILKSVPNVINLVPMSFARRGFRMQFSIPSPLAPSSRHCGGIQRLLERCPTMSNVQNSSLKSFDEMMDMLTSTMACSLVAHISKLFRKGGSGWTTCCSCFRLTVRNSWKQRVRLLDLYLDYSWPCTWLLLQEAVRSPWCNHSWSKETKIYRVVPLSRTLPSLSSTTGGPLSLGCCAGPPFYVAFILFPWLWWWTWVNHPQQLRRAPRQMWLSYVMPPHR